MKQAAQLAGKKLCLIGGTGYIGSNIAIQALKMGAKVVSVSRGGRPEKYIPGYDDIEWIKGDSMNPAIFEKQLKESDAVVQLVGTLIDKSITSLKKPGEEGTYEHMNRETAISVGRKLEEIGGKKVVFFSAASAPPLLRRYITTKREAEDFLLGLKKTKAVILRPGFVVSKTEKKFSVAAGVGVNAYAYAFDLVKKVVPERTIPGDFLRNYFDMEHPIELDAVVISAIVTAFDKNYDGKILSNKDMEYIHELYQKHGFEPGK